MKIQISSAERLLITEQTDIESLPVINGSNDSICPLESRGLMELDGRGQISFEQE